VEKNVLCLPRHFQCLRGGKLVKRSQDIKGVNRGSLRMFSKLELGVRGKGGSTITSTPRRFYGNPFGGRDC